MGRRNLGSTKVAFWCGVLLFFLAFVHFVSCNFSWRVYGKWVDGGACLIFGSVLIWWAKSKKPAEHIPNSEKKIGFETVTMVVAVLTAIIAIFTLTGTAADAEKQLEIAMKQLEIAQQSHKYP